MPGTSSSPMGEFFDLTATIDGRRQHAVVTEVAASLRSLAVDGVALIQEYPVDARPPYCAGWVLVPWPNRVADGLWTYDGVPQQLECTEPGGANALHGLLTETPYRVTERTPGAITLAAQVRPQAGYPFELETSVRYELAADGIHVSHMVRNTGSQPAPVGLGAHPFLRIGEVPTRDLKLVIDADTHIEINERLIPTGTVTDVTGTRHDFRTGRLVRDVDLDDAWAGVRRNGDGGSTHYLEAPDGSRVRLHMDGSFGYVQAFTTDNFVTDGGMVTAVALEPMTAPADALNSGEGLRWLRPGEEWELSWSIAYQSV
ncbi:aldose 1-epimerase family protein [Arthrobacter sp. PAMC25284]|uniref:aldose 1-epimerase family protein n=1 Tax=Arthrobacter sp. PAMC25284 TaxID=2861279 RepID=UPI001C63AE84|nr:aldose 1-epimerase family protein [Arthrobacter sp. PAMC25284]QYF89343.1 aldose 1-epimerase family protein [Arthrobacter sp. PAMC25284]